MAEGDVVITYVENEADFGADSARNVSIGNDGVLAIAVSVSSTMTTPTATSTAMRVTPVITGITSIGTQPAESTATASSTATNTTTKMATEVSDSVSKANRQTGVSTSSTATIVQASDSGSMATRQSGAVICTSTTTVQSGIAVPGTSAATVSRPVTTYSFGATDVRLQSEERQKELDERCRKNWEEIDRQLAQQQRGSRRTRSSRWGPPVSKPVGVRTTQASGLTTTAGAEAKREVPKALPIVTSVPTTFTTAASIVSPTITPLMQLNLNPAGVTTSAGTTVTSTGIPTMTFSASQPPFVWPTTTSSTGFTAGRGAGILSTWPGFGTPDMFRPRRPEELEETMSIGSTSSCSSFHAPPMRMGFDLRQALMGSSVRPPPGFESVSRPGRGRAERIAQLLPAARQSRPRLPTDGLPPSTAHPRALPAPGRLRVAGTPVQSTAQQTTPANPARGQANQVVRPRVFRASIRRFPSPSAIFTQEQIRTLRDRMNEARRAYRAGIRANLEHLPLWTETRWILERTISEIIVDPEPSLRWPFSQPPQSIPRPANPDCDRCQLRTVAEHSHTTGPVAAFPMCPRCLSLFEFRQQLHDHLMMCLGIPSHEERRKAYDHRSVGIRVSPQEGPPIAACPAHCLFTQAIPALRTVHYLAHREERRQGRTNCWVEIPHLRRWSVVGPLLRPPAEYLVELRGMLLCERMATIPLDKLDMRLRGGPAARPFSVEQDILPLMFAEPLPRGDCIVLERRVAEYRNRRSAAPRASPLPSTPRENQEAGASAAQASAPQGVSRDPRLRRRAPSSPTGAAPPAGEQKRRDCFTPEFADGDNKRSCHVDTPEPPCDDMDLGLPGVGDERYETVTAERDPPALQHYRASAPAAQATPSQPPTLRAVEPYRLRNPNYEGLLVTTKGQRVIGTLQIDAPLETGMYNVVAYPLDPQQAVVKAQAFYYSLRNPADIPILVHQRVAESTLHVMPSHVTAGLLILTKTLDGCGKLLFQRETVLFDGNIIPKERRN